MLKIEYAQEIIKIYGLLDEEHKKTLEEFISETIIIALTDTKKTEAEKLAYLIALLPEQEQGKIYYMLKGFEVFGKPLCTKNN